MPDNSPDATPAVPGSTVRSRGHFRWARWYWVVGGALYGLALCGLFGALPPGIGSSMSIAFLVGTPLAIGALTIYGERFDSPTLGVMVFKPWGAVALMLIGCALTLVEGAISAALLSPLFLACSSIGGMAMGLTLRLWRWNESRLKAIALLPLLLLMCDRHLPPKDNELELRASVVVNAHPHAVWTQILNARAIRAAELPLSLTHLIGVPKPLEAFNVRTPTGEVRYSRWERGVNFRAQVTNQIEDRSISWRYVFDEHSFPAGSMDDHVAIGGRYFRLRDTTFNLKALPGGKTELELVARHRVTTTIDFYAVPAATLLGYDFIHTILTLYKDRSEHATTRVAETGRQAG